MIEKWTKSIDNEGAFKAYLTDLPEVFDYIAQDIIYTNNSYYTNSRWFSY